MQTAMRGMPNKSFAAPDWVNLSGKHYGSTNRPQVSVEDDSDRDRSNQDDPESLGGPYPTRTSASSPEPSSAPSREQSSEPSATRTASAHTHTSRPTSGETTHGGNQLSGRAQNG